MENVTSSKFISCKLSMWWFKIASRITFNCSSLRVDSIHYSLSLFLLMKLNTSRFCIFLHSINSFNKSHEIPVKSISMSHELSSVIRHKHKVLMETQFAEINASMKRVNTDASTGMSSDHWILWNPTDANTQQLWLIQSQIQNQLFNFR